MRSRFLMMALLISASAYAGFLPLLHDRPKRDNPNDPAVKPLSGPVVVFPTVTITPTPVPGCGNPDSATAFATFETGTDSVVQDTCCTNFVAFSPVTSSASCKGSRAFCGSATFAHSVPLPLHVLQAVFKRNFSPVQNWSGKTLSAWAYTSAGFQAASVQIYIKSNGFVYSNGPISNPPAAGGWFRVSFNLAATANYIGGVTNTATVSEVGLQLYSNAGDPDGTLQFCLDDFAAL